MMFSSAAKKDIIKSIVVLFVLYFIINNPITHPIPTPHDGNWSISLMQHPLLFGIAGHNYLVLKDDSGAIKKEMHGLATNPTTGAWRYVGADSDDILQAWIFSGSKNYSANKKMPGVLLYEGNYINTITHWGKGEACVEKINSLHISYPPLGISIKGETENSNSVAYTLTKCMELPESNLGWFTPGSKKDLLERSKE
jgi:hypothetical protein